MKRASVEDNNFKPIDASSISAAHFRATVVPSGVENRKPYSSGNSKSYSAAELKRLEVSVEGSLQTDTGSMKKAAFPAIVKRSANPIVHAPTTSHHGLFLLA
jgi:hypothetical protein